MQPQEQPVVKIGQLEIRYLMDGTVTGAGVGMFELTVGRRRAGAAAAQSSGQ